MCVLPVPGRPVEQKPLARLEPQRFELLPSNYKSSHIVVEHSKSFARQDDVVAAHFGQAMHFEHTAAAHRVDMPLKGNDAPTICSALADQKLQIVEQLLREPCPAFAGRKGNFNLHAAPQPEPSAWRHQDRERQIFLTRQP